MRELDLFAEKESLLEGLNHGGKNFNKLCLKLMKSIIIDLKNTGVFWQHLGDMPKKIRIPKIGNFKQFQLYGKYSCVDFLANKETKEWVGISLCLDRFGIKYFSSMFKNTNSEICKIIKKTDKNDEVYINYPKSSWVNIIWSKLAANSLIEVCSDTVLWYGEEKKFRLIPKVRFMVIEDVDYRV